jgi:hypothetical protein
MHQDTHMPPHLTFFEKGTRFSFNSCATESMSVMVVSRDRWPTTR